MRAYAPRFGGDEEEWGLVGMLHDLDYERYPSLEDGHPRYALKELERQGFSPEFVRAVASHADFLEVSRDSDMEKALYAVDELSGFVMACAYVRPTGIHGLTPKSVKKKMKTPAFAAAVNRDELREGAEALGVDFDEHLTIVIAALGSARGRARAATAPKRRDPLRAPLVRQLPEGARDARPGRRADYERVELDLFAGETRTPEHFARNPDGRIPVLELDDGQYLAESGAILLYLAEGTEYLPADPVERARVHAWMFFEQNQVEANIGVARFLALSGRARAACRRCSPTGSGAGATRWPRSTAACRAATSCAAPTPSPTSRSTATSTSPTTPASPLAEHPAVAAWVRARGGPPRVRGAARADARARAGPHPLGCAAHGRRPQDHRPRGRRDRAGAARAGDPRARPGGDSASGRARPLRPLAREPPGDRQRRRQRGRRGDARGRLRAQGRDGDARGQGRRRLPQPDPARGGRRQGDHPHRPAHPRRRRAGLRRPLPDLRRADGGRGRLRRQAVARGRRGRRRRGRLPHGEDHALDVPRGRRVRVPDRRADPGRRLRRAEVDGLPRLRGDAQGGDRPRPPSAIRTSSTGRC